MSIKTIADVFIIESLSMEEENQENKHDGKKLADLLRLSGKNPKYFYFTSKNELPYLMQLFKLSRYRFLHISCHASDTSIFTTEEEEISFQELSEVCKDFLKLRRLFVSACSLGSPYFTEIMSSRNKGMQSIIAPAEPISFDYASAIWSSFYVSMINKNKRSMNYNEIAKTLQLICQLFPVDFYFGKYRAENDSWEHLKIKKSTGNIIQF